MKKIPVYTEEDEKRFNQVLREIQGRIPPSLLKGAISEKEMTPTIKFVMEKALESEVITPEKKEAIKALLEAGEFSKMKLGENNKITKKIDEFVNRETNKAIKAGLLPPRGHVQYLPSMLKIKEQNAV